MNYDTAIKKYFKFYDNNVAIDNDKMFKHQFSGINPNMDIISRVTTTGGLVVKTPEQESHDKNMQICNDENDCINMNVNSKGFNITPNKVKKMTINSKDNTPMASFDMESNSIYFGGSDINSPMFIQDGQVYVNNINMIEKENTGPFEKNVASDYNRLRLQNTEITDYKNLAVNLANNLSQ